MYLHLSYSSSRLYHIKHLHTYYTDQPMAFMCGLCAAYGHINAINDT